MKVNTLYLTFFILILMLCPPLSSSDFSGDHHYHQLMLTTKEVNVSSEFTIITTYFLIEIINGS